MSFYPNMYPGYPTGSFPGVAAPLTSSVIQAPIAYAPQLSYAQPTYVQPSYVQPTYAQPTYAPQVSYVQPVAQPVQYVQPQPVQYVQPVQHVQAPIKGESRVEYREFQRQVVEMETETVQIQVPKTKYVTDYYPVEYETEYIPRTVYEQQTEFVPVTKTVPRTEYEAVEREVQRVAPQPVQTVAIQPVAITQSVVVQPQYSIARPVVAPALTYSTVRPSYAQPQYYPQQQSYPQRPQNQGQAPSNTARPYQGQNKQAQ